ncbi:MAG: phosphate ABC transporter substrate-binding protein [Streptococcaceae bacterium]|jgi:phosphate transport system substrate-binding protein|nr:phosphate ABC transporter substrate-binding protein [Streptococcaceae bacterium]
MKKKLIISLLASASLLGSVMTATSANAANLSGKIIAGGSTAIQPLVQQASLEFMAKNPGVQVTVQGGGSGVGLTQVGAGTFQIGNSDIFAEEKSGIEASKLSDYKVAVVGFAPIVNSKTSVSNLSKQQLIDVFTGKITNWKEVGGKDQAITVIGRTAGSGTRVNFDKLALDGATEVSGPTQDASGSVVTMVGQTPGAISYVAMSYVNSGKNIKSLSIDKVKATPANVKSNAWKIWSYEHMYLNKSKATSAQKAFIKYVTSSEKDINKLGYISISSMKVSRSVDGTITKK